MQAFTKYELTWIIGALGKLSSQYLQAAENPDIGKIETGLLRLRSEQLSGIADRLGDAIKDGDKRIKIEY